MLSRPRYILLLPLFIGLLFAACKQDVNRFTNRAYHNTTAHFNGYFNARETVKETNKKLALEHKEDFTLPLPLFIYPDDATAKALYPEMETVLERCSKVIHRHSMEIKGEERCKWIDDTWILMGQAHFLKRDFKNAEETFRFVSKRYRKSELKDIALLWQARTYIEKENYSKADRILNRLDREGKIPQKQLGEFYAVYADFYVQQGDYDRAIDELKRSIEHTRKKKVKTRRMFILGQLHQKEGNSSEATRLFAEVEKRNPPYEMAFYSKINRALSTESDGGIAEVRATLNKMLRDDKNIEFQDQIYYALAELELKENDKEGAIDLLKKATRASSSNDYVKGLAFLKLADLYFEEPDYANAQIYYDSTVTFISRDHPDFESILGKANSLGRLVRDVTIIEREDSLQRIAGLDERALQDLIQLQIDRVIEEEEEKERQEQIRQIEAQRQLNNQNQVASNNLGRPNKDWYFYNVSSIGRGSSDFRKSWGDRELSDHWRRSDRSSTAPSALDALEASLGGGDTGVVDLKDPEYYMKQIPVTQEQMDLSNGLIIEALFDLAAVYREEMNDEPMAIETLEELMSRYDTCKYAMNSYYQLYLMHANQDNMSKSGYYKNLLFNKYPDSDYAKVIKNPNYLAEKQEQNTAVQSLYDKTYTYYRKGYYLATIEQCDKASELYPENDLRPKFDFLRAMSIGSEEGEPRLLAELGTVVTKYRGNEVSTEAQRIIDWLKTGKAEEAKRMEDAANQAIEDEKAAEEAKLAELEGKYSFDPESAHACVLLFPSAAASSNSTKIAVSNFNKRYFGRDRLRTTSILFKGNNQLISIKQFPTKEKAMEYYDTFKANTDLVAAYNTSEFNLFVISYTNYSTFYKDKNVEEYIRFFRAKYFDNGAAPAGDTK